jgi:hypothetical protein
MADLSLATQPYIRRQLIQQVLARFLRLSRDLPHRAVYGGGYLLLQSKAA